MQEEEPQATSGEEVEAKGAVPDDVAEEAVAAVAEGLVWMVPTPTPLMFARGKGEEGQGAESPWPRFRERDQEDEAVEGWRCSSFQMNVVWWWTP